MFRFIKYFCLIAVLFSACAGEESIFPDLVVSTDEASASLPSPISIAIDEVNSQILVANSNVDVLYDADVGSLALLSVGATDTAAPNLTATEFLETPSLATQMIYDGVGSVYLPFRAESAPDSDVDQLFKFSLAAGDVAELLSTTVDDNPYGIATDGTYIYVVSDDILTVYDSNLAVVNTIDLDIEDSYEWDEDDDGDDNTDEIVSEFTNSENAEAVAIDATRNRAIVSNRGGYIFVVNLGTSAVEQIIIGPLNTRELIVDGDTLYALDGNAEAVWIFDLVELASGPTVPSAVEDSTALIDTTSVGSDPNGMALDSANNRLYVANTDDDSISVLDTLIGTEVARISLDDDDISTSFARDCDDPFDVALGTFNTQQYLFVSCFSSHAVFMMRTDTLALVEVYPNTTQENRDEDEDDDDE